MKNNYLKYILIFLVFINLDNTSFSAELNIKERGLSKSITDCSGRRVRIPEKTGRIACLYAFAGHAVTMLGRGDDIIAVSNGLKRDSLLHKICPSILNARVPKVQGALNIEELLKAEPDIVFVSADILKNRAETDKLDGFKIPWLVVDYKNIEEQEKAIKMIGEALNESKRAELFNGYTKDTIKLVRDYTDTIPQDKRISLYHSVNEANRTSIDIKLSTDWLDILGVVNVAQDNETKRILGKNFVNLEQIYVWNPNVIFVNEPHVKKHMLSDRQWARLSAVKKGMVFQMPLGISRWGHPGSIETPLAILWAAKMLYPDQFSDIDMSEKTKEFYKKFYRYDLSNKLTAKLLAGKIIRKPKNKKNRKRKKDRYNEDSLVH